LAACGKGVERMNPTERGTPVDAGQARASRARLFAALPRYSGTAIALRNKAYSVAPTLLTDERLLIWQDTGALRTIGELSCRMADWPLSISADNLAGIEPRLEGFETFVPTDTCAALVEHALSPVITLLERLAGVPVECDEFRRGSPPHAGGDEVAIGFVVLERNFQLLLRGWVRTTPDAWHQLDFSRAMAWPTRRTQGVPIRLSVQLGRCHLRVSELRSLAVGDALRPDTPVATHSDGLPVHLNAANGRLSLQARLRNNELTLEHRTMSSVDTDANSAAQDTLLATDEVLNEVECEVTFELGSMRLTVADIGRMRAGQAMRLGVRLQEQPVRILVNGRLIARGELAAVGDELVVLVTDTSRLPHL
jgi:type III secretion system YscQ/HrcQ family protein